MELKLEGIKKSFEQKEVLHDINFSVTSGKALGLLGRNGAGKTTTIRIIMDVFHANEGTVYLDGKKFDATKTQIGYLPEERGLYPKRVIYDQLVYLARLRGLSKKKADENTKKWLKRLEVDQYINKKMDTLSKGNQQKVQLAATLVADPDIVILDEPFSGLDPVNSQILKDVISEVIAEGKIVIFSSHQMSYVEEFCEDIVIIDHGNIVMSGNIDEIKEEYGKGRKVVSAEGMEVPKLKEVIEQKLSDTVKVVGTNKHFVILELMENVDQWTVIEKLHAADINIKTFGVYEPSLTEIFVEKVGEEAVEEKEEKEASNE